MAPIITLISDWRLRDPYLAMFKGRLLSALPDAQLLDITHHIDPFDIGQSAFVMKNSYLSFPEGSVHIMLTNTSASLKEPAVVVSVDNHYFVGVDNGVFSLMFAGKGPLAGRQLAEAGDMTSLQGIVSLAQSVVKGTLDADTIEYTAFKRALGAVPVHIAPQKTIEGEIVYIDAAFNAVTNIPTQWFREAVGSKPFQMHIHSKTEWVVKRYCESYTKSEDIFLTNNALQHLQISMYQGKVALLANLSVGDKVEIEY